MLQDLKSMICVDDSREIFARDTLETIMALLEGDLRGQDRYRRILFGKKSAGKTKLLDALVTIAQKHFKANLVCVRLNYSRVKNARLPIDHVIDALGLRWQLWWCAQKYLYYEEDLLSILEQSLEANGVCIFGIIDDFDEAYKVTCPIGVEIIDELFHIGCSKMGVMHWILSGSSKLLRKLVTGNLREEDRNRFKNYTHRDLNDP